MIIESDAFAKIYIIPDINLNHKLKNEHRIKVIDMGLSGFIGAASVVNLDNDYLGNFYYDGMGYSTPLPQFFNPYHDLCLFRETLLSIHHRDHRYPNCDHQCDKKPH